MQNYFMSDNGAFEIYGGASYSEGQSIETTARRRRDGTNISRGFVYRKIKQAKTATVSMEIFSHYFRDGVSIMDYMQSVENLLNTKQTVVINGRVKGDFIVTGVQVSINPDATNIIGSAGVSINLTEGKLRSAYVERPVVTGYEV